MNKMFEGKTACISFLAMSKVQETAQKVMEKARSDGREIVPFNGREITLTSFLEYMENCPLKNPTVEDMVRHYLTFEGEHKFEEAARKRAEKNEALAKMGKELGLKIRYS